MEKDLNKDFLGGMSVRSADVGYGNVKYTLSHLDAFGPIVCDIFPSRSPVAGDKGLSAGFAQKRDTTIIHINGINYEVGKGVAQAQGTNDLSSVLDNDFCMSDAYMARFRGALHYMLGQDKKSGQPYLQNNHINLFMAGLPVSNFCNVELRDGLRDKLTGKHELSDGRTVTLEKVVIIPQPMGAFFEYAFEHSMFDVMKKQNNLIIDPGFYTFDWLLSTGLIINEARSNSVNRGMSAVMAAMVEAIKKKKGWKTPSEVLFRLLDDHYREGEPFFAHGENHDANEFVPAGRTIINEAVAAMVNSVGDGADIHNIVLAGGGAKLYLSAIQEKFPHHKILVMENPVYSNVRGFQLAGERQIIGQLRRERKEVMASTAV